MRISDWSSDVCSSYLPFRSLIHPFQQIVEIVEARLPETRHPPRPVGARRQRGGPGAVMRLPPLLAVEHQPRLQIGRASCRESVSLYVEILVVAGSFKTKNV